MAVEVGPAAARTCLKTVIRDQIYLPRVNARFMTAPVQRRPKALAKAASSTSSSVNLGVLLRQRCWWKDGVTEHTGPHCADLPIIGRAGEFQH